MPTTSKQLTVRPESDVFLRQVDEYAGQLPAEIREPMRQALQKEFEGDYEKVEEICLGILEKDPDNMEALPLLGRTQLAERKYEEALESFRKVLEKEPGRNFERIAYGITLHALLRYPEALQELQKVDPEADYHPFYYSTLADCYENTGNRKKARDAYRAEIARWEKTRETASPENLDGCFCSLIYLDASLSLPELPADLDLYRDFLNKADLTPEMTDRLAGNIAYWSSLLTVASFRDPFVQFVKDVELEGWLMDSPKAYIIESAYRAAESYRYHEDNKVDAFMESFLSAEGGSRDEANNKAARATQLVHEWYMSRCVDEYAEMFLYVAEQYPYSYMRTVTFLDQFRTFGAEKIRDLILDRLEEEELVQGDRATVIEGLEQSYRKLREAKKQPVYLAEGGVTYRRNARKIMPNDPCPCGSGKKYKKCHGRLS